MSKITGVTRICESVKKFGKEITDCLKLPFVDEEWMRCDRATPLLPHYSIPYLVAPNSRTAMNLNL